MPWFIPISSRTEDSDLWPFHGIHVETVIKCWWKAINSVKCTKQKHYKALDTFCMSIHSIFIVYSFNIVLFIQYCLCSTPIVLPLLVCPKCFGFPGVRDVHKRMLPGEAFQSARGLSDECTKSLSGQHEDSVGEDHSLRYFYCWIWRGWHPSNKGRDFASGMTRVVLVLCIKKGVNFIRYNIHNLMYWRTRNVLSFELLLFCIFFIKNKDYFLKNKKNLPFDSQIFSQERFPALICAISSSLTFCFLTGSCLFVIIWNYQAYNTHS